MLETARQHRLEGIVAKRLGSLYQPGRRSTDWRKIKLVMRQEFVVGGWTQERGSPRQLGALHVGYFDASRRNVLHYAGGVGSGFTTSDLKSIWKQLQPLSTDRNPFAEAMHRRDLHFVEPKLVIEVEYRRWPADGLVQQAAFKGVRTDKRAAEVVREDPACTL
jgi:bifunctional non-homologous end joining protein LigD